MRNLTIIYVTHLYHTNMCHSLMHTRTHNHTHGCLHAYLHASTPSRHVQVCLNETRGDCDCVTEHLCEVLRAVSCRHVLQGAVVSLLHQVQLRLQLSVRMLHLRQLCLRLLQTRLQSSHLQVVNTWWNGSITTSTVGCVKCALVCQ